MRILLCSSHGCGAWFLLRLQREGHKCDWLLLEPSSPPERRVCKGLVPKPLDSPPADVSDYDLVIFDSTGHGDLADECAKQTLVIGDSSLSSRLEDDRLYGIEIMQQCGIEVPDYETFQTPDEARKFLKDSPKRYVYKPFTPAGGDEQDTDTTYVSESAEDMERCLDQLFADSQGAPFLLQEVVEGTEVSTEGWFDGQQFLFPNHTFEEKKFMAGGYGPNTGCSGNLMWAAGMTRLFDAGVAKLAPFLAAQGYRGMVDLNTIVNEQHVYGLEFTPRFGYDSSATLFSLVDDDLGTWLARIASGDGRTPRLRAEWSAGARYSIPPYPEEVRGRHPRSLPIKGIAVEDAWLNCYLYDAMLDGEGLMTAGVNGNICVPIASGHTPEGAWAGVERLSDKLKIPNMQVRCDLKDTTIERLHRLQEMGWVP